MRIQHVLLAAAALCGCIVDDPGPGDRLPVGYVAPPAALVIEDLAFGKVPGDPSSADRDAQRLDLYLPASPSNKVIVWMHGGGFWAGDHAAILQIVRRQVANGFVVASVGYRNVSCPGAETRVHAFPEAVIDVKLAVRWLKVHGPAYGFTAERIILAGQSAGGYLATFAAVNATFEPDAAELLPGLEAVDSSVSAMVSFVGPTDLVDLYHRGLATGASQLQRLASELTGNFAGCPRVAHVRTGCEGPGFEAYACSDAQLIERSPVSWLDANDPPAYLAYGARDQLLDAASHGAVFAAKLAEVKANPNTAWLDWVEDGDHFLGTEAQQTNLHLTAFEAFLNLVAAGAG